MVIPTIWTLPLWSLVQHLQVNEFNQSIRWAKKNTACLICWTGNIPIWPFASILAKTPKGRYQKYVSHGSPCGLHGSSHCMAQAMFSMEVMTIISQEVATHGILRSRSPLVRFKTSNQSWLQLWAMVAGSMRAEHMYLDFKNGNRDMRKK